MNTKNMIKQLTYMFLPAILFKLLYSSYDILLAMLVSFSLNIGMIGYNYKKYKKVNNSLIIGLCATFLSLAGYLLSNNERVYFLPAILENFVFIALIVFFILRGKCVVLLFLKDFNIKFLEDMDEKEFLNINYLWLFVFALRFTMRAVSLFLMDLSFDSLYWIAFLAGDPVMLPVFAYTYYYFRKKIVKYASESKVQSQ